VLIPPLVVLQGKVRVFGKNVDKTKMEIKAKVENFLGKAFQKFHIAIWSCVKLEDVLENFPYSCLKVFCIGSFSFRDVKNFINQPV
jgi:hypothetical protein